MAPEEPLSKEQFIKVQLEKIIKSCKEKTCDEYSFALFEAAKKADDAISNRILRLLGDITSLYMRPESANEPFDAMTRMGDKRSAIVDDFDEDQLIFFENIIEDIDDADLRARIADVLWIRKRDVDYAKLAIDSYIETAINLEDPKEWPPCAHRIERAFRLSIMIGGIKSGYLNKVIAHIESVLDKYDGKDPLYLTSTLLTLLIEAKQGNFEKYRDLASKVAEDSEATGQFRRAHTYWEVSSKINQILGNSEQQRLAQIRAAETYVKEAGASVSSDPPGHLAASFHIQSAIEAYRRIGGEKDRIDELHAILLEYQEKSLDEMKPISGEIDLGDYTKKAIDKVRGKSLRDAFFDLALMLIPPRVEDLRKQVIEDADKHIFQHLAVSVAVNENGKVISRQSSMFSDDETEREKAIFEGMLQQAELQYQLSAQALIEPVRRQIVLEHHTQIKDFMEVVSNHPLIPQGREFIYAQGLKSGLDGDYLVAAHLLIPQIEHSIRYVLSQKGGITSGIDSQGIQDEYNLNKTLYMSEVKKFFGDDLVFNLQGLLIKRFGSNLRNRMAHGLMGEHHFYTPDVVYLWAFILRLICAPLIRQAYNKEARDTNTENSN